VKDKGSELDGFNRRALRAQLAFEDVVDAQQQLARLKGLGKVVVSANLQAPDAILALISGREHQDWHERRGADGLGKLKPRLSGHHDVKDEKIEAQAAQLCSGFGRTLGGGDAIALALEKSQQQITDPPVVINDQEMGGAIGGSGSLFIHDL
jgi:hypothetical protein